MPKCCLTNYNIPHRPRIRKGENRTAGASEQSENRSVSTPVFKNDGVKRSRASVAAVMTAAMVAAGVAALTVLVIVVVAADVRVVAEISGQQRMDSRVGITADAA